MFLKLNEWKPKYKDYDYIFFDFETRQDESLSSNPDIKMLYNM